MEACLTACRGDQADVSRRCLIPTKEYLSRVGKRHATRAGVLV